MLLLTTAVLRREGRLDPAEWRFLSTGGVLAGEARPNPAASWLPQSAWLVLFNLGQLPAFQQLVRKLAQEQAAWRNWRDAEAPEVRSAFAPEPGNPAGLVLATQRTHWLLDSPAAAQLIEDEAKQSAMYS